MKKILFVCTGNTCRSVLAHYYAAKLAADLKLGLEIASAGLAANEAIPQPPIVGELLKKEGVKKFSHKPVKLTAELSADADVLLTMTAAQKARVAELYPEAAPRTYTLLEYAGQGKDDIPDPFGLGDPFYFPVFKTIKSAVAAVLEKLKKK